MKILHINLRLPIELHSQLVQLAKLENRSLQKQIIYILQQWLIQKAEIEKMKGSEK